MNYWCKEETCWIILNLYTCIKICFNLKIASPMLNVESAVVSVHPYFIKSILYSWQHDVHLGHSVWQTSLVYFCCCFVLGEGCGSCLPLPWIGLWTSTMYGETRCAYVCIMWSPDTCSEYRERHNDTENNQHWWVKVCCVIFLW